MEIIILGTVLVVCFIVTWIVISANSPTYPYLPPIMQPPFDFEKDQLRREIRILGEKVSYLESRYNPALYFARNEICPSCHRECIHVVHPCSGEHRVLAKSPDEQKIVDLLKSATKPLDQLKKEFGIK